MCDFLIRATYDLINGAKVKSYKVHQVIKYMKIQKFEDIIAWQKAKELTLLIYTLFRDLKDFSFKNQIERASISIMNNIAEGFERQTNKELKHFLYISKGSAGEVRSMSSLAVDLRYLNSDEQKKVEDLCVEISKLLSGFIKTL
jgi:four helix bundle protein